MNGISIIPDLHWSTPDSIISTDACLQGIGGVNFTTCEYFHADIPISLQKVQIFAIEMYAIYIAMQFWVQSVCNNRLQLLCDNQACVQILNVGSAKDCLLLYLAHQIWYLCAKHNVQLHVNYIPSSENRLSDFLSRWNLSEMYFGSFFYKNTGLWFRIFGKNSLEGHVQ
jgi:hypothetical protein